MARRGGWRARGTALLIGGLGALLAVEIALQAIAYLQWRRSAPPKSPPGEHRVVCIGDSFTFGLGAERPDEQRYPRVLQALATASGKSVAVAFDAWPGNTSADALRATVAALRAPADVVYVLVGVNDLTRRPALMTGAEEAAAREEPRAFPLRSRLAMLATLVIDRLRGGPAYAPENQDALAAPPFVGVWHIGEVELRLDVDGSARFHGTPYRWRQDGARLVLESEFGAPPIETAWRVATGLLFVTPSGYGELPFQPGPARSPLIARADELARTAGEAAAEASLRAKLDDLVDGPAARLALVQRLVGRGAIDDARTVHAGFAPLVANQASPARVFAIRAAFALGDFDDGIGLGLTSPTDDGAWWGALDEATASVAARAGVAAALARAADIAGCPAQVALHLHQRRAVLLRDADPQGSLDSLVRAILLADGAERERLVAWSFRSLVDTTAAALDAAIARLALAPDDATLVRATFTRQLDGIDAALIVLDAHLRRIVAACVSAGATPVLLGYPFPFPRHRDVVAGVARATGVAVLDLEAGFPPIGDPTRGALFAPDGHCNAAGYARMAEVVHVDLSSRIAPR